VAESDDRTRLVVAGERSRLARELHESLAGSISVVQAEAARAQLAEDPSSADQAMTAVEQTGRQALADMRRILGALRHGEAAPDLSHCRASARYTRSSRRRVMVDSASNSGSKASPVTSPPR